MNEDGGMVRRYSDTGVEVDVDINMDERGVIRLSGNRSLESVLKGRNRRGGYRGGCVEVGHCISRRSIPPHLVKAMYVLEREPPLTIREFASSLCVKMSTAWCYACLIVERNPSSAPYASMLVYPPLFPSLKEIGMDGSLSDLMVRLNNGPLNGDTEWRCVEERFSHLRLARICLMCE